MDQRKLRERLKAKWKKKKKNIAIRPRNGFTLTKWNIRIADQRNAMDNCH